MRDELQVFTIYDATWANGDDVRQGSAVMKGDRCVEYQVRQVMTRTKRRAMEIFENGGSDLRDDEEYLDSVDYVLDPPKSNSLTIVIHDDGRSHA